MSINEIFGLTQDHLVSLDEKFLIHHQAKEDFEKLVVSAQNAGFKLRAFSAYRSFEQQKSIWNAKASGKRTLQDSHGNPIEYSSLSSEEIVEAILRWSALPGLSRHHWGSDIDIVDQKAIPEGYQVELIPDEVKDQGIFGPLHCWLDDQMANDHCFGFFRPYQKDLGGVAPERWHLSYRPVSEQYLKGLEKEALAEIIRNSDLLLKEIVLPRLDQIIEQYAYRIST